MSRKLIILLVLPFFVINFAYAGVKADWCRSLAFKIERFVRGQAIPMKRLDKKLYDTISSSPVFVPGEMESIFSKFIDSNGRSSYDILVDIQYPNSEHLVVVDVPSGSGPISKIVSRLDSVEKVYAVDYNPNELAVLGRGKNPKIVAVNSFGDELPIKTASVDFVFCHLGVMVFNPLQDVLREFIRILKPGGRIIFNTISKNQDGVFNIFADVSNRYQSSISDFSGWGDSASHSDEILSSTFNNNGFYKSESEIEYTVSYKGKKEKIITQARVFFQIQYLVDDTTRRRLISELESRLEDYVDSDGDIILSIRFKKWVFTKGELHK